ncbi:MAG: hypothetical protein U0996_17290 [Planctomycetaceae bacterium]
MAVKCPALGGSTVDAAGVRRTIEAYCLRRLEIGGITFVNVPVGTSLRNAIGMPILRHFDMTVDLPGHRLWLDPLPSASKASFALAAPGSIFSSTTKEE